MSFKLRDGLKGDIIQKFGAAQPLYRLEEAGHQSATFFLEVSLRGQESHEVTSHVACMCKTHG